MPPLSPEPIAIVGMALRVPGANSLEQFWLNILNNKDCLTRPSAEELRLDGVSRDQIADPHFIRASPMLEKIEYFDAPFFDMAGFEAERTDPTHRLFLECAWEALECACIVPGMKGDVTGVFGGAESRYYRNLEDLQDIDWWCGKKVEDRGKNLQARLGTSLDFLTTRVSHKLGFTGPSFGILSACATSLVAVHIATQALRRRECTIAIVGGASIEVPHVGGYISTVEGMLSATGRIRPFDKAADGTIFGSGVGIVVLRPLADALANGNPIFALIGGTATSNDGKPPEKESFIAPSPEGQRAAVESALRDAKVSAQTIGYLEAHGTATLLGDPVEVSSIADVYRHDTTQEGYCALGSVKANVGHLRTAAGVVSLIKTCLALKHRTLPPLANFTHLNPHIQLEQSPFYINTTPVDWSPASWPRRAAVSSFGFGGSNAHLILEEFTPQETPASSDREQLFVFSAGSAPALKRKISDLVIFLDRKSSPDLAAVARTLQTGRMPMSHRACFQVSNGQLRLRDLLSQPPLAEGKAEWNDRSMVFLFPGQGAQRPGMGEEIYNREPLYQETVDYCADLMNEDLGIDLRTIIHTNGQSPTDEQARLLRQTAYTQPALFVVEYALAKLFLSWGVEPKAMVGHSIGEIVAACLAGVFSLQNALRMVVHRGKLMQECDPGEMGAVFLPESEVQAILPNDLEIAAVNAPKISVVSGPGDSLGRFIEKVGAAGIETRRLHTSHAFHSWMMEPALEKFHKILGTIELLPPQIPIISNTTGQPLTAKQAMDPAYWSNHVRHTVRFSNGIDCILTDSKPVFLELGPGHTLSDLVRQHDKELDTISTLKTGVFSNHNEPHSALVALGSLWCKGVTINWRQFHGEDIPTMVELPSYPFERQPYWLDPGQLETEPDQTLYLYETSWRKTDLPAVDLLQNTKTWLIFCDELGLGEAIGESLTTQKQSIVKLLPGQTFAETSRPDTFEVRPSSKDDLKKVLQKLSGRHEGARLSVLFLWSVTGASEEHNTAKAFTQSAEKGFHTLVAFTQAANELAMCDHLDVLIVADGLRQREHESGQLHAEKGALIGPLRNIPNEFPGMTMRLVDITSGIDEPNPKWLMDSIIAESQNSDGPSIVLLRPEGHFIEELYTLPSPPLGNSRLRQHGTVLITGGMGDIGLEIAKTLFETSNARLVLTSRWDPPPRDQWSDYVHIDDRVGHALRRLQALEERGADLMIIKTDTSDLESLQSAVEEAKARFGSIHGVVHCAGGGSRRLVILETKENSESTFGAKVQGAFHLEKIFSESMLDFFVCISSQASSVATDGQIAYSGANAVLDVLMAHRSRRTRGLSLAIGYGPLEEIGMAVSFLKDAAAVSTGELHTIRHSRAFNHPLLKTRQERTDGQVTYRGLLCDGDNWVLEHRFKGRSLLPAVAILECVRAAYVDHLGSHSFIELTNVALLRPLFVEKTGTQIEIVFMNEGDIEQFQVRSRIDHASSDWVLNMQGALSILQSCPDQAIDSLPSTLSPFTEKTSNSRDFSLGSRWGWECIQGKKVEGKSTWAKIVLPEEYVSDLLEYDLHPAMFDRGLHIPLREHTADSVPYTWEAIRIYQALGKEFFVQSTHNIRKGSKNFDVKFFDGTGQTLIDIEGYVMREVQGSHLERAADLHKQSLLTEKNERGKDRRVVVSQPGDLHALEFQNVEPRLPNPGEVQIEVIAAGLNFRDVLATLDQLPREGREPASLGVECSGIVKHVGPGVTDLCPGDPVVALAQQSFATTVTTSTEFVVPIPPNVTMEEAAGIPIIFLTVDYALNELARIRKNERILIHAAAGGVGLAAVQISQKIGAEIFATAGSEEKRQFLRDLGISHVMDSRSLAFMEDIIYQTGGEGVDVVLNSLAGDHITSSLKILRYRGRFLEIGKRDIYADTKLGLYPFRNNLTYHAIDLGQMLETQDPIVPRLFNALMLRFQKRELYPVPTTVIPITEAAQGLQRMALAEHIGKIVFKIQEDPNPWRASFQQFRDRYGFGVPVKAGLEVFRRLVSCNAPPTYVLTLGKPLEHVRQRKRVRESEGRTRLNLSTSYRAPSNSHEETLVRIWENVLGIAPIGIDDDFIELGGDSITAIRLRNLMTKQFGHDLPMTILFDCPTIGGMAQFFQSEKIDV